MNDAVSVEDLGQIVYVKRFVAHLYLRNSEGKAVQLGYKSGYSDGKTHAMTVVAALFSDGFLYQ